MKNNFKHKLFSILTCFIFILGASIGFVNLSTLEAVYAADSQISEVSLTNPDFDNSTSSTLPFSPTGYDSYAGNSKVSTSSNVSSNVTAGVINLTKDKYSSTFSSAKRTQLDDYVLMIDSSYETTDESGTKTTKNHSVNYGYRTSSAISFDANSNYMITVDVYTNTSEGIANLYLYDNENNVYSSMKNISSLNCWSTYSFFVSTNEDKLETRLGMYLIGQGVTLFDNLSCYKISNSTLNSRIENLQSSNPSLYAYTNKVDNIVDDFKFVDNTLTNKDDLKFATNSSITEIAFEATKSSPEFRTTETVLDSNGTNNSALKIKNIKSTYVQFATKDDFLTFDQLSVYKVNVSVKTKNLSGNANLQLVQTNLQDNETATDSAIIKITSDSSANAVTNDYKSYCFYVYSHPLKSTTYKLVFGLGDSETATTGEMFVGGVTISKVNFNTYSTATTGSTSEKIDLTKNTTYSGNSVMLNNANFNAVKIEDYSNPLPATPTDWTVTLGNNNQKYGVVNTSDALFNGLTGFSNLVNPNPNSNNNVLMMYNETADTLSYTSATKSLNSNSYHKFEIDVQTQNSTATIALVSTINDKEVELTSLDINTNSNWKNVALYIHTGNQSLDVAVKLTMKTTSYGYAYFDQAKFDFAVAPDEDEFEIVTKTNLTNKVDLSNIMLSKSTEQWANPTFFTKDEQDIDYAGIINLNSEGLTNEVIDEEFETIFKSIDEESVLGIHSNTEVSYKFTSSLGYTMTTDKYYKLSVSIFTQQIEGENLGANFKLSTFDESFTAIKSNNSWTTYTFFINPSKDVTTYLEFGLGTSDNLTSGSAYFGKIDFVESSQDEFDSAKETSTLKLLKEVTSDSEETTENETTEQNKTSNSALFYAIPSIIFALAIVLAIIVVLLRKVKWKKPRKKSKNEYDRNRTVSKQVYMRRATTAREAKLRELNTDLETAKANREKFENEYKQDLSTLRSLKLRRGNAQEIAKLEKKIKHDQKLTASIGVTINRIESEISYAKTDAYLNSLAKKFSREISQKPEENKEEKSSK